MDEEEYSWREPRSSLRTRFFWVFCFTFYTYASYEFVLRPLITFLENEIDSITMFILASLAAVFIIYSIIGVAILAVERKIGKVVYSRISEWPKDPILKRKERKYRAVFILHWFIASVIYFLLRLIIIIL